MSRIIVKGVKKKKMASVIVSACENGPCYCYCRHCLNKN